VPSVEWNRRWGLDFQEFRQKGRGQMYGNQWGDPEVRGVRYLFQRLFFPRRAPGPLYKVVDDYVRPYVKPDATVLEIGSGGGRWTRYLVSAKKVIAVDLNQQFFAPLRTMFPDANFEFYQPEGFELRGVAADSIDFVFTFGTFVHIDPDGISQYLGEIRRVLKREGIAVVHYAAKDKPAARINPSFSDMTAEKMAAMAPMEIVEHNTQLLNHSNLVVFRK
jgi:SAM-dependent methyltransferase